MERLLDFSQPLDISLLDTAVKTAFSGGPARAQAETVLTEFRDHPDAWQRIDTILESNVASSQTRFFALQVLESAIAKRWKTLPTDHRNAVRDFIVNLAIKYSSDEQLFRREKVFVGKLDLVLVQILKQEWPHNWGDFMPQIVKASYANETLCENNLNILKLLSEEVFDFSRESMTQQKVEELKQSYQKEFSDVFNLCDFVIKNSQKVALLENTLDTLLRFLRWIPSAYVFETDLIAQLVTKFLGADSLRNRTLQCLVEIASFLNIPIQYRGALVEMYISSLKPITDFLPIHADIAEGYHNGTQDDQDFVQYLALFFTTFFKNHLSLLESKEECKEAILVGMEYLVKISTVEEMEVFRICLDYWNIFLQDLYTTEPPVDSGFDFGVGYPGLGLSRNVDQYPRRSFYARLLSRLREVIISRMAKPEEWVLTKDDSGNIVREFQKDTDQIYLYKIMKEVLVFLTHLDPHDTENIMIQKLQRQLDDSEWSHENCSRLAWAIGSISDTFREIDEKRFLVTVIKDLLCLCEQKKGKNNKAVVAGNIMYVVGQYPRFLRQHWKFLKTVVMKLFEFMHESHEGVQDMACDTLLKITEKCRKKFVVVQQDEVCPFVETIIEDLESHICDLPESHQINTVYKCIGMMLYCVDNSAQREAFTEKLFKQANNTWGGIVERAMTNVDNLRDTEVMKIVDNILSLNCSVAETLKEHYASQMSHIFNSMLHVYRHYSEFVAAFIKERGPVAARYHEVRLMMSVKRSALKLLRIFIQNSPDPDFIYSSIVPQLLDPILGDYTVCDVPAAREAAVLSLFETIVKKLQLRILGELPRIMGALFARTLEMITANFQDFPDHRINFFKMIEAITTYCFEVYAKIDPSELEIVINSIVWAFKHTEHHIMETGLSALKLLVEKVPGSSLEGIFYVRFLEQLTEDVYVVMTDTLHKPGFQLQSDILVIMFHQITSGRVRQPIFDTSNPANQQFPDNVSYLRAFLRRLLGEAFSLSLSPSDVDRYVDGLLDPSKSMKEVKSLMRDFLVEIKEFKGQDNSALFADENAAQLEAQRQQEEARLASVPGLRPQFETLADE